MKTIHLQLTLDETNQVLEALGHQPYMQVWQLIDKIRAQAKPQLQEDHSPEIRLAPANSGLQHTAINE